MPAYLLVTDMSLKFLVLAIWLILSFIFGLQAQTPPNANQIKENLVHFGDLIDVDVVGSFEYDWRGTLNPEGFLDGMDKIANPVYGLCRSEGDLAAAISKEYGSILRNPVVVVRILDRSNRAVAFLYGAVKSPQRFQIRRRVLLNELLILSGGITDMSSGEIRIFRPQSLNCDQKNLTAGSVEKATQEVSIRIPDLLAGSEGANPAILSGDIVTVVKAAPVFLTGGVNVPKQISLRVETTLSRAIAMGGGVSKEGLEDKIHIFRRDGKVSKVVEANLEKIRAKEAEDPVLQAYDVVEVEQKRRGTRKLTPFSEPKTASNDLLSKLPLRIVD